MIEDIKNRLEVGYTLSVYGTREVLHEQMENDIKYLLELQDWKYVSEQTPPNSVELLAKSPSGCVHLCNWREAYSIFTVQAKSESSYDWQWKLIN